MGKHQIKNSAAFAAEVINLHKNMWNIWYEKTFEFFALSWKLKMWLIDLRIGRGYKMVGGMDVKNMEQRGVEPLASWMRIRRSTNWATVPKVPICVALCSKVYVWNWLNFPKLHLWYGWTLSSLFIPNNTLHPSRSLNKLKLNMLRWALNNQWVNV